MLGHTGVAHYGRRCSWAHSEGHIGVTHYGILVGGPLQLRWQPIGRGCLWAHLGEVPTKTRWINPSETNRGAYGQDRNTLELELFDR